MNTDQIVAALRSNPYTNRYFVGCFPCNLLAPTQKYPAAWIANTEDSWKRGQHWVAIFTPSPDRAEFFDPLGKPPNKCIRKFLEKFKDVWCNRSCVQANWSQACGLYTIIYIINRCKGLSRGEVISSFKNIPPSFLETLLP